MNIMLALQLAGMQVSPLAIVRSILSLFSGSLYLPSPSSSYQDASGTLPCTVDTPVGLMLDEMRTLGPELVTNGSFDSGITGWTASPLVGVVGGGSISYSNSSIRVTNGATGGNYGIGYYPLTTVVGKTYKVTLARGLTSGGGASWHVGIGFNDSLATTILANQSGITAVFVAPATTCYINLGAVQSVANAWAEWDNISVREVTGIHATQATAGFKPILRGKVKNLFYPSNAIAGNWSVRNTASLTGGQTDSTGGTGATLFANVTVVGAGGNNAYKVIATGFVDTLSYAAGIGIKRVSTSGTLVFENPQNSLRGKWHINLALLSDSYERITRLHPAVTVVAEFAGTGTACGMYFYSNDATVLSFYAEFPQLELGTVANPYVATGATPASSSYGPYCAEFDGAQTRQVLTSVPAQMSDDHFLVVGCTLLSTTANTTIFAIGNTTTNAPHILISYLATSGFIVAEWRDDAGTTSTITGTTNMLGVPHVVAIVKQGNAKRLFVNGVQVGATNNTVMAAATFNVANIGCLQGLSTVNFFNGKLHYLDYGIGAISDAQLLTTMRLAGQQTGVTI